MEVLPGSALNSFLGMSMTMLVFLLFLRLFSMLIADIYTAILYLLRIEPVHNQERLTVQPPQTKSRVDFIDPVRVRVAATCVTTERNIEQVTATPTKHHAVSEPVRRVPRGERFSDQIVQSERIDFIAPVQVATTCVKTEPKIEKATPTTTKHQALNEPVMTTQNKRVDYIGPVLVTATCAKAEPKIEKAMTSINQRVPNEPVHPVNTFQSERRPVQVAVKIEPTMEKAVTTTKHQAVNESVGSVKTAESETRVDNNDPVQVVTCVETEHKKEEAEPTTKHQAPNDPVRLAPIETGVEYTGPVQVATCANTEHEKEEATATRKHEASNEPVLPVPYEERLRVQTTPDESRGDFINPGQAAATCAKTEQNIEVTVKSNSNVVVESQVKSKSDSDIGVEEKIDEGEKELEDSEEQRNEECGEEMSVEASSEIEVKEDDDDDDWEGIERSELEKVFMVATEYVGGNGNRLASFGSNVQMDFYGLHKVATEGPCRDPHPLPLMFSARAKWNAWQKLGNMSPEVAMEQYVSLLSDIFPGWMEDTSAGKWEHEPTRSEVSESAAPDLCTSLSHQQLIITERKLKQEFGVQDPSPSKELVLENNLRV